MKRMVALAALSTVVLGCADRHGKPAASPGPGHSHGESQAQSRPEHAHNDEALPDTAVVRIEPNMLRDLRVTTAVVEKRPGTESAPVVGELRVPEDAYAEVASPVSARVVRVPVTAGQQVKRGQLLAEVESLDLGKARGEHREAVARVDLARKALDRKRSLAQERIAPQREVQEAEAELRAAEASLGSASATLQAMGAGVGEERDGALLRLRAPIAGVLIERNLAQGEVTEAAQTLFRIGDLSRLWLVAHAPERDAVRVRAGSTARVAIAALPGQAISARVVVVGSLVEVASRTIPVRLEIPNPQRLLRPGMSATVWLPVEREHR